METTDVAILFLRKEEGGILTEFQIVQINGTLAKRFGKNSFKKKNITKQNSVEYLGIPDVDNAGVSMWHDIETSYVINFIRSTK